MTLTAGSVDARASSYLYGGGEVSGYGTITAATLGNAGMILASGDTLMVNSSITGTGTMQNSSGAAMELGGSAVATQNILFGNNANILLLETLSSVRAHILDFSTGDTIDLLDKASTKMSYATGAMTVSNGTTQVAKLGIKGSYTMANPKLVSDGHGDSMISHAAAAAAPHAIGEPIGIGGVTHLGFAPGSPGRGREARTFSR